MVQVFLKPKGEERVARLALLHREQLLNLGGELVVPNAAISMESDPG